MAKAAQKNDPKNAEKTETVSYLDGDTRGKTDVFLEYPEKVKLIDDPEHPLYDERMNLPMNENMVLGMMVKGVKTPIVCRRAKDGVFEVTDGRQRVRHLIEANRRLMLDGKLPLRIAIKLSSDKDNEVFENLVMLNSHRTADVLSVKARNLVRYLEKGHTEADAIIYFNLRNSGSVKKLVALAATHPDVQAAVDAQQISMGAALNIGKAPYDEQPKFLRIQGQANVAAAAMDLDSAQASAAAPIDVKGGAQRLIAGATAVDAAGNAAGENTPKRGKPTGAPQKRATANDVKRAVAASKGETVVIAPGKKQLTSLVETLNGYIGDARTDQVALRALLYGVEFAMAGESADRPECVTNLLKQFKAIKDGTPIPENSTSPEV